MDRQLKTTRGAVALLSELNLDTMQAQILGVGDMSACGGAPAIIDLAAGRVQMLIGNMTDFLGQVKTGKLRGIAFGGERAAPVLPDLPLIKQWLPKFSVSNWFGIVGPGRLPAPIMAGWNGALQKVMADPAVQARMADNGVEILAGPIERFNAEIAAYRANWSEVIRAAGIRAE